MVQACNRCGKEMETLRRCKACASAWYCSERCQKADWVCHIVDCKPQRPITTADYLMRAVDSEIPPDDDETCRDYGFDRVDTPQDMTSLFELYREFTGGLGVKAAKKMNTWRVNGTLIEEVHKAYGRFSEDSRGPYYAWFLKNQHVLSTKPLNESTMTQNMADWLPNTWRFIGGSPTASYQTITDARSNMSHDRQLCFGFYLMTLHGWRPPLANSLHLRMGFLAVHHEDDGSHLSALYRQLINHCSFDEFCAAYISGALPSLFAEHGIVLDDPFVLDLLASSVSNKSVWNLKLYVIQPKSANARLIPSVAADYGFMYCQNEKDMEDLKQVYKQVLLRPGADPLALHQAAIQGKIFEHVRRLVTLKPKERFARLMWNIYSSK